MLCRGCYFMCRRNHLRGCLFLGFGLGLLVGQCLESGFLCTWGGIILIIVGVCTLQRRC